MVKILINSNSPLFLQTFPGLSTLSEFINIQYCMNMISKNAKQYIKAKTQVCIQCHYFSGKLA